MVTSSGPASTGGTIDYGAVAGFYSQLAGVLAGFAFAGLVALVAAQLTSGNRAGIALQSFAPLISSFIGLVATSLNYAIISSEGHTARGAGLETVGGLGFCVAGLMLFYSILVLLYGVATDVAKEESGWTSAIIARTVRLVRKCINLGLAPLVMFLLYGGVTDQETYWYSGEGGLHWPDYLGIFLVVSTFALGASLSRPADGEKKKLADPSERTVLRISAAATAVALLSVAGTSVIFIFTGSDVGAPGWVAVAEQVILEVVVVAIVFSSSQFVLDEEEMPSSANWGRWGRLPLLRRRGKSIPRVVEIP
jgi:hypothetical protein